MSLLMLFGIAATVCGAIALGFVVELLRGRRRSAPSRIEAP
jgi:hypothetical protein